MVIDSFFSKKAFYFVLAGLIVAVLCILGAYLLPSSSKNSISVEPVRTEYSETLPPNIPEIVSPKTSTGITQSYLLDYVDQGIKQSTVVTSLEKTPLDAFKEYEPVLRSAGWVIVNTFESPELTSIYAIKSSQELNITISKADKGKGSILSISALNK